MDSSNRLADVQSPIIPIVGEMIRDCPGTISLGQGVVHYGPPPEAIARIAKFLENGENHKYHLVKGFAPLLDIIREKLETDNGIRIESGDGRDSGRSRICVTAGANMGFMNAALAIADPGDEIILPAPYYFNQEMAIRIADCRPVVVPTDQNYLPDLKAIRGAVTERTRAVVTISPNNPTGVVYPEPLLREVNAFCKERGLYHISDEAYEYFVFDDGEGGVRHFSPASTAGSADHTISLFSLSKSYGFAGWRIGYMVYPERLEVSIKKIQDTILICPTGVSEYAAEGALEVGASYCREKLTGMVEVREIIARELATLGDLCLVSDSNGAFYYFLKIATDMDDMVLVERLVREHGVAVIPGRAFGMEEGCYLRISYGPLRKDTAREGIRRLVEGLKSIVGGAGS